jgi:hypothetical protein
VWSLLTPTGAIDWMGIAALQQNVLLGARHEERGGERQPVESLEVEISAIRYVEGARLGRDLIQDIHVMHFAVGNAHEQGDIAMQVYRRVHLHRTLALAKTSPRKHRQTQINRGRVEGIGAEL